VPKANQNSVDEWNSGEPGSILAHILLTTSIRPARVSVLDPLGLAGLAIDQSLIPKQKTNKSCPIRSQFATRLNPNSGLTSERAEIRMGKCLTVVAWPFGQRASVLHLHDSTELTQTNRSQTKERKKSVRNQTLSRGQRHNRIEL
jgi:hypothetical protein